MAADSRSVVLTVMGGLAVVFGLATVASGGAALFAGAEVGNAVPFVLWFNFLAGFLYVAAGAGMLARRRWSAKLALGLFVATAAVALALAYHVWQGGAFEQRTVGAMALRTGFWAIAAAIARRGLAP